MPLLSKLHDAVAAKINKVLNSSVSPEDKMEYSDEKFRDEIGHMQFALAQIKSGRTLAANKRDAVQKQIDELDEDAKVAVQSNRDDLARTLLERKLALKSSLTALDQTVANLDATMAKVQKNFDALTVQYNEFKAQKADIIGRAQAAKAEKDAYGLVTGIGTRMDGIKADMSQALDQTEKLEAQAQGLRDVAVFGTSLDDTYKDSTMVEVEKLRTSSDVDAELQKLKDSTKKGAAS